jgi:alpha-ketoglutarate-dependent taurine dioxygenase
VVDAIEPCVGHPEIRAEVIPGEFPIAEVRGLDAARHVRLREVGEWLRALLWRFGVMCVRQTGPLDDASMRSIVSHVGTVKELVARTATGDPIRYGDTKQIIDSGFVLTAELRAELGDVGLGGDELRPSLFQYFHTDDSYMACPAAATVLHARQIPLTGGGATEFLDMRAAFELLDADRKRVVIGRRAMHAYDNHDAFPPRLSATGDLSELARVSHPIVRAHPVTDVPALYFDLDRAIGIEGMPNDRGRPLLQSLQDHAEHVGPRYAHAWQPHDVLVWDNAAVQHRASGDFAVGEPRRFWRYMVEGTAPSSWSARSDRPLG